MFVSPKTFPHKSQTNASYIYSGHECSIPFTVNGAIVYDKPILLTNINIRNLMTSYNIHTHMVAPSKLQLLVTLRERLYILRPQHATKTIAHSIRSAPTNNNPTINYSHSNTPRSVHPTNTHSLLAPYSLCERVMRWLFHATFVDKRDNLGISWVVWFYTVVSIEGQSICIFQHNNWIKWNDFTQSYYTAGHSMVFTS